MRLGELIAALEEFDPKTVLHAGFATAHSYRGYYDQLAFEPAEKVSVGSMLAEARSAVGKTFPGYKGGDYRMTLDTRVWLASHGTTGRAIDGIGLVLGAEW